MSAKAESLGHWPTPKPVAVKVADVIAAIRAMGAEAARRGQMYPQESHLHEQDRKAERNVIDSLEFYERNTGCAKLNGWPTAPVATIKPPPIEDYHAKAYRLASELAGHLTVRPE
jgi:hypothetical protein